MAEYAAVVEGRKPEGRTVLRRKDGGETALRFRGCKTRVAGMAFFVGVAWPE
jgi:hypothetical protein